MSSTKLSQLVDLDKRSINPNNFENTVFNVYSLPSYDQNKKPEKKIGGEIKSINNLVSSNTILFNKLNVRFKRIWNIHELDKESLCSGEFLRLKPQKCNQDYLYYFLQTESLTNYLIGASGGSSGSHSRISSQNLMALDVDFPDIRIQEKIASVLLSIDAKVEINNKIKGELEILAKMIYDYWFVQFDFPDENGNPYKSSGGKMVWSDELNREIPKGWEVCELGKICDIYQPQTISEKEMVNEGSYYVFGANGVVGMYDKYNHQDSEIVVTCRGSTCGNITRTYPFSWITGNAMVVKFKTEQFHNEFIYCLLHNINIHRVISGSAQPQITRANLSPIKVLFPSEVLLNEFSDKINVNVAERLQLVKENQRLVKLRDWLLPMLMNGQIKVDD